MTHKYVIFICLLAGILISISVPVRAQAQEQEEEEFIIETKTLKGELTMLSSQYLGILSERDKRKGYEKEVIFLLDEEVKFTRKKREEIEPGDRIRVKYEKYYKPSEDEGEEAKFAKRVVKEIQFIRRASKGALIGMEDR